MINLISLEEGKPVFNIEVKMFKPFRRIIERDKGGKIYGDNDGRKKYLSTRELAFIYWFTDPRSIYTVNYKNEQDRVAKLKVILDLPEDWKPDDLINEAIEFYKQEINEDFFISFIDAAVGAAEKTKEYFKNVDYNTRDSKGRPLYDGTQIMKMLKDAAPVIESLKNTREKMLKGVAVNPKIRGGGELKMFEE